LNVKPETEKPSDVVRLTRDLLSRLDQIHKHNHPGEAQLDARISSYELAARMQMQASDALDISKETDATREMYGIGDDATDSYGKRCLMAATTIRAGLAFGWPAPASSRESLTAIRMSWATKPSRIRLASRIGRRPCCTCWVLTINASPSIRTASRRN